jgi:hypothetical protein
LVGRGGIPVGPRAGGDGSFGAAGVDGATAGTGGPEAIVASGLADGAGAGLAGRGLVGSEGDVSPGRRGAGMPTIVWRGPAGLVPGRGTVPIGAEGSFTPASALSGSVVGLVGLAVEVVEGAAGAGDPFGDGRADGAEGPLCMGGGRSIAIVLSGLAAAGEAAGRAGGSTRAGAADGAATVGSKAGVEGMVGSDAGAGAADVAPSSSYEEWLCGS